MSMSHRTRVLLAAGLTLVLGTGVPVRAAQMYMNDTVIVVSPKKGAVDHSVILGRFAEVLRLRNKPEPVVQGGLGIVLQTAYYYYWEGEKLDLFFQAFAADATRPVDLGLLGSFFVEVTDLKSGKAEVGQYQIDPVLKEELVARGSDVVGLGPATPENHELLAVFYLEDFAFVSLAEGVYRITLEYIDNPRAPRAWRGRIKSNEVIVEVIGKERGGEVHRAMHRRRNY